MMTDGDFLRTSCGSPNYAAPEVIYKLNITMLPLKFHGSTGNYYTTIFMMPEAIARK